MSDNQGKIGEMRVLKLVCDIVTKEENADVTRHTNTNTADGGADIVLEHSPCLHQQLVDIASGNEPSNNSVLVPSKRIKTRIDVKTTENKISKDTVEKFGGDIRKNPDCKGHMLLGGSDLTRGAKKALKEIQEAAAEDGKQVSYVSNTGLNNLENHYTALPNPNKDS